jgi:protein-disulfide isomerase
MPQIQRDYIDTGKIRYVFMDFPLPMHAQAMKASEAALCAGDQDKFWEMHDHLFANQNALDPEALLKHAEALGLDTTQFKECLESGKQAAQIKTVMAEGQKAGIAGAPTFLLGFIEPDGKVRATKKIVGVASYENLKTAIDEMLSSKK